MFKFFTRDSATNIMPEYVLLFPESIIFISKLSTWDLWIEIAHDSMRGNVPRINVKCPCFYSTCFIGIAKLCSCPSRKGSISVLFDKYRNFTTTVSDTPQFMGPSESMYPKYTTVPLAQLCNPNPVHIFDNNMISELTEKYSTSLKLFASIASLL